MIDPAQHPAVRTDRSGTVVPVWEKLIALAFLTGPTIGTFWAPEIYFSAQEFSIKGVVDSASTRSSNIGGIVNYVELIWIAVVYSKNISVMFNALLRSLVPLLFALIIMISVTWAPEFSVSFNRSVRLVLSILLAIYLVERFTIYQILSFFSIGYIVSVIASFFAVFFIPVYGMSSLNGYSDAWRGAFTHKNVLGAAMSNAILVVFFAWRIGVLRSAIALPALFGTGILLVQARSATAGIGALVAIASIIPLVAIGNTRRPEDKILLGMILIICLLPMIAAVSYLDELLLFIGRDPNLTGRTEIWQSVWKLIQENPWIGYGHAFWSIDSPLRASLWTSFQWAVPNAHNTALDIWFQIGIFGLISAIYIIVSAIRRGVGLLLSGNSVAVTAFWLSILVKMVVSMFSETLLVDPGGSGAFWLCLAYASLTKIRQDHRARQTRRLQTARLGRDSVRV